MVASDLSVCERSEPCEAFATLDGDGHAAPGSRMHVWGFVSDAVPSAAVLQARWEARSGLAAASQRGPSRMQRILMDTDV